MADVVAAVNQVLITAEDRSGAGWDSATARARTFESTVRSIGSTISSTFAALGVGISFAAFEEFARHIVLAAEDLRNFSVVTGSSVEDLSRLSNAARISGVGFDTFKTMVERLASQMQTIGPESTKAQKALEFLGISARDPAQALEEVAVELEKYADGAGKAAIARDLFGRGGPEMVAALHAIATANRDLVTTTTEDAEAAAKLAEQVRTLGVHMTALKDAILRDAVPALNAWINGVQLARAQGLGWLDSLRVGTTFADRVGPALKDAQAELAKLNAELEKDKKYFGNWATAITADIDNVTKRIAVLKGMQLAAAQALISPKNFDARDLALPGNRPELDYSSQKAAVDELLKKREAYIASLVDEYAKLTLSDAQYKEYQATLLGVADKTKALREEIARLVEQKAQEKAALELAKKLWEEQGKAFDDARKHYDEYQASLTAGIAALQLELATIGMSSIAAREYALAIRIKAAEERGDIEAVAKLTEQMILLNQIAQREGMVQAAKDAQAEWKRTSTEIENDLVSAFEGVLNKGKNLFEQLKSFALKLFEQLVLRPVLAPIAGGIASIFTPGVAGATPPIFPGGGGLFGGGGGLFGGLFGDLPSFGTALENIGTGFSTFTSLLESGTGIIQAGSAALAGLAPSLTAVLGPIGLAAGLALPLLSSLFKGEPSPVQGTFGIRPVGTPSSTFEDQSSITSRFGTFGFLDEGTKQFSGQAAQIFTKMVTDTLDAIGKHLTDQQVQQAAAKLQAINFGTQEGTFTTEEFLAKYGGQVFQQVIGAALGELDPALEKVVADFHGTSQQLATFADQLLTVHDSLAQFKDLNADQIESLFKAFGGIDKLSAGLQFLNANFTQTSDRIAAETKGLSEAFASLGYAVPQDHKAFLDLLNSLDLTTEAGQKTYAAMVALAPAFVDVYGTADQAAQALQAEAEANAKLVQSASEFFNANFYSDAEKQAQKLAAETKQVTDAQQKLGITIPTTVAGFRALIEQTLATAGADSDLYKQLIVLAPAIFDLANASKTAASEIQNAANTINEIDFQTVVDKATKVVTRWVQSFETTVGGSSGDFGVRTGMEIQLIANKISDLQAALASYGGVVNETTDQFRVEIEQLTATNADLTAKLAEFTTLKAQYGADIAEQLLQLETWYDQQKRALGGNIDSLTILKSIFDQKWHDIITGVGGGVDGTIAALKRIQDYLDSLKVGSLSVLSPASKLTEASKQFADELALAQGGDAKALGDITKFADTYLQLAQQYFGGGTQYVDIYSAVTQALQGLVTSGTSGLGTVPTTTVVTTGGAPVATDASMDEVKTLLRALVKKVDESSMAERVAIVGAAEDSTTAIVGAIDGAARTSVTVRDKRR